MADDSPSPLKRKAEEEAEGEPEAKRAKAEGKPAKKKSHSDHVLKLVQKGSFIMEKHFYLKVHNAKCHPLVSYFFNLPNERIAARYAHLHPGVDYEGLLACLNYKPAYFHWSGADLFNCTTSNSDRRMVIIETNSCPSGMKSTPQMYQHREHGSYWFLIKKTFKALADSSPVAGGLAVVYDKNPMETSGYAATIADVMKEPCHLVEYHADEDDPNVKFVDDVLHIRTAEKEWVPIRAALRYITQKPWSCFPLFCKTKILNPVVCCLAGGRNKLVAAKAYDIYNSEILKHGIRINTPQTRRDVSKNEIPLWVESFGGKACVKVPYSNAGQGVYTITNETELQEFMDEPESYDQYIVQALIGNYGWSSVSAEGVPLFHVGTVPDATNEIYVADLRMMIAATAKGWIPVAAYSRRAEKPLTKELKPGEKSWEVLGTNLSFKTDDGAWDTDVTRLLLMDEKNFNRLGLGLDDLVEAFVQTVLAVSAIDRLASRLLPKDEAEKFDGPLPFDLQLFRSLDNDPALLREVAEWESRPNNVRTKPGGLVFKHVERGGH